MRFLIAVCLACWTLIVQAEPEYQIKVKVSLADELKAEAHPKWPVYIYAAAPGSRVPLASFRTEVDQLPMVVTLDETMYVLPQFTLKGAEKVELVAKISAAGDPHKTGPQDMAGRSTPVVLTNGRVVPAAVKIDRFALSDAP